MSKADREAGSRLRRQVASEQQRAQAYAAEKAAVRPRLEGEIAALVKALLPLLEEHGTHEMTPFRVAASRRGLMANFKRDRAGWAVATVHKDSSWGATSVTYYLLTNGEFIEGVDTETTASGRASGGYTSPVHLIPDRDLAPLRDGLELKLDSYSAGR